MRSAGKSPLTPPFDYAQGMLFQRGELGSKSAEPPVLTEYGSKSVVDNPPLKKGEIGGFEFCSDAG
jgi:hypothetical protein